MRPFVLAILPVLSLAAVFPPDPTTVDLEKLLKETSHVRSLDRETLRRMVPRQSGLFYVGCPNCNAGHQERKLAWTPEHPEEIYCRYCQHRYPSVKYAMDKSVDVRNPRGELHSYPYWEDASGYRYFFAAKRDDLIREYLATQTRNLALLWVKTGDRAHAERASWLLTRFAEVFPGWAYHYDYPFQQKRIFSGAAPSDPAVPPLRMARWTWWCYNDMPEPLLDAWDWIRSSGVTSGTDAARIEKDLFREAAEEMISRPEENTNMSPRLWRSLVRAGRILNEPRYSDEPMARLNRFLQERFYYDGSWSEGAPSYASQTINGLREVLRLRGDSVDLPELRRAEQAFAKLRFPDGRRVPVHDTWWTDQDPPLTASTPFLLPALGHAGLGGGSGPQQWQVHLTWAGGYGHQHADRLSLILWGRGRELLSDLGYTHTRYRPWTLATAAHNTVVIDERNQEMRGADGSLRIFDTTHPRVQVVRADGERAYPNLAKLYRRTLVTLDGRFLVDWFEVEGGQIHDYLLHGDANRPGEVSLPGPSQPVADMAGWQPTRNEGEIARIRDPHYAYGFLRAQREIQVGRTGFLPIEMPEGLRIHFLAESGDRLYAGSNPSIRGAGEDDARLESVMRGFFRARREGGRSLFVSVIELRPGSVQSVERTARGVRINGMDEIRIDGATVQVPTAGYSLRPTNHAKLRALRPEGIVVEGAPPPPSGSLLLLTTSDGWTYPVTSGNLDAFVWDSATRTLRLKRFPGRSHSGDVEVEWR